MYGNGRVERARSHEPLWANTKPAMHLYAAEMLDTKNSHILHEPTDSLMQK